MLKQVEETTPTTRKLKVDIPSSAIEEEINNAYNKLKATAKVPGFRAGKVPLSILEKKFGKNIEAQVLEKLVPEFYANAIKEAKITPITFPYIDGKLEIKKNQAGTDRFQPLSFTATVEIKPHIKDLKYENITLKEKPCTVEEHDIENAIKALQSNKAVLKVSEGPLTEGDVAIINCDAFIDGKEVIELRSKEYPFAIGSPAMPKEFSSAFSGRKKGDNFEVKIDFEQSYPNKAVAGKDVLFKISVIELKETVLPQLDDEFAKDFNCSTMEELRKKLTENIQDQKTKRIDKEYKDELMDYLNKNHDIEVPQSLIKKEIEFQIDRAEQDALGKGQKIKDKADLEKEYEPIAFKNVKTMLIIEAIGTKENVKVVDEDIKQAIDEVAAQHSLKHEEVKKLYIAEDGSLDGLKHRLYGGKVLDVILSKATIEKTTD